MNDKLQNVIDVLPVIFELTDEGSYLTVMDSNSIVQGFAVPKGETPMLPIGSELNDPSGAFDEVVKTGKKKYNYLPKEVMGVAFEGVLVPIKDNSQVVGVLIYTHSVGEKEAIRDMATDFRKSITDIDQAISNIIDGFDNINTNLKGMKERTTKVDVSVKSATEVVGMIQNNAKHSTILALNASIEAARSGEAGRGFTVVASEMGKLSNSSGSSAKEINTALDNITKQMEDITQTILETNDVADTYLDDIRKTKEILEKTLLLAEELQKKIK